MNEQYKITKKTVKNLIKWYSFYINTLADKDDETVLISQSLYQELISGVDNCLSYVNKKIAEDEKIPNKSESVRSHIKFLEKVEKQLADLVINASNEVKPLI
jgi:hypothetical protein